MVETSRPNTTPSSASALEPDLRLYSEPAARNRQPILDVLKTVLPTDGLVLELASGTGEHVVHFAAALPNLIFQPTDLNADARASVAAWTQARGLNNVLPPIELDAASSPWPVQRADAIVCINMIHISPWASTEGLFKSASQLLPIGGPLYLYGPYKRNGAHTAPSNVAFEASLRERNPQWGIRDIEAVTDCARRHGFQGPEIIEMPANNLSVVFRKI